MKVLNQLFRLLLNARASEYAIESIRGFFFIAKPDYLIVLCK